MCMVWSCLKKEFGKDSDHHMLTCIDTSDDQPRTFSCDFSIHEKESRETKWCS